MMQAKAGVMAYLLEYHRLSGVGPSLMEVASKDVMLEVLSRAFSTPVQPSDLKFIRYRKVGKGVELEDMAGRLGGILTSVEPQDADPKALIAFLKKHGAKTFKAESLEEGKSGFQVEVIRSQHNPEVVKVKVTGTYRGDALTGTSDQIHLGLNSMRHGWVTLGEYLRIHREGKKVPDGLQKKILQAALAKLVPLAHKAGNKKFTESLDESNQVGKTIIQQMGGSGAIRAMLGGSVVYLPKGVGIRWPNKQRSRGNYVEVILTPADLYDVTFYNMKGAMKYWHPDASKKQVKQYRGVMFDQLREIFYSQTGWVLSKPKIHKVPSSPGRKARIDKAKAELLAKWKKAGLL